SPGPGSVAGERNSVVLIPLEFWLADPGDVAANHLTAPVDCAAQAQHLGGDRHSCGVQRNGIHNRHHHSPPPLELAAFKNAENSNYEFGVQGDQYLVSSTWINQKQ